VRRRLSLLIAFAGVFGLMVNTPAQAGHDGGAKNSGPHEHAPAPPVPPTVTDPCVVQGRVEIANSNKTGGVQTMPPTEKNHNHFTFNSVGIICVSQDPHFNTTFDVLATGGTDGQGECDGLPGKEPQPCVGDHGEQLAQGFSHSSCYHNDSRSKAPAGCVFKSFKLPQFTWTDLYAGTKVNPAGATQCTNCGEIQVFGANGKNSTSSDNYVKFCRGLYTEDWDKDGIQDPGCSNVKNGGTDSSTGGSNVLAWGQLNSITGKAADLVVCFLANLEFIPKPLESGQTKINGATLDGTARIWQTTNKADCEGKKKGKA